VGVSITVFRSTKIACGVIEQVIELLIDRSGPSIRGPLDASSMKDMIMNKKLLGALGAVAILAGAAVAFQFAVSSPPSENLVAQRIEGRWLLDADITARLDAQRGFMPPRVFEFAKDDVVVRKLVAAYPRFQGMPIFTGGTAVMNGEKHWFLLTGDYGNTTLMLFTPVRDEPMGDPHYLDVNMALSRDSAKDLMFIGGDFPRDSAAAYKRMMN
jgi:hypothetical protein